MTGITYTMRQDIKSASKINEVNEKIKTITPKYDVKFIDDSSMDNTSLNVSKLHLNAEGSVNLATHFISFIKGGQSSTHSSRQDFQTEATKLWELQKLISRINSPPIRSIRPYLGAVQAQVCIMRMLFQIGSSLSQY